MIWGRTENRDGSLFTRELDEFTEVARMNGLKVRLTITGVARLWECNRTYNPCFETSTTVARNLVRVSTFSLWNEPNLEVFLALPSEKTVPARR